MKTLEMNFCFIFIIIPTNINCLIIVLFSKISWCICIYIFFTDVYYIYRFHELQKEFSNGLKTVEKEVAKISPTVEEIPTQEKCCI